MAIYYNKGEYFWDKILMRWTKMFNNLKFNENKKKET